jgi:hypothetical protein
MLIDVPYIQILTLVAWLQCDSISLLCVLISCVVILQQLSLTIFCLCLVDVAPLLCVLYSKKYHYHHSIGSAPALRIQPSFSSSTHLKMCIQLVEKYSVCRCVYHRHSVDPCRAYGQRNHGTTEKTILVGFACPRHTPRRGANESENQSSGHRRQGGSHDSGYSSGHASSGNRR